MNLRYYSSGRGLMKTTSRGFTLTEILTVLTILLALAAIIIPVVWVAQQKSHDATCKSNIRQVSLAILMYCNDNDGRYPDWNAWLSWEHSHNSPLCPDAKFPKNLVEIPAVPGYNINQRLAQGEIDGGNPSALTQGEVTFPSATVLLCEQGVGENNGLSSMANLCLVGDSCRWYDT